MRGLRVALLHRALDISGGAERQLLTLAQALRAKGHDVTIFTNSLKPDVCFPELLKGVTVRTPLFRPHKLLTLPRALGEFDVVNIHNFPANIFASTTRLLEPELPLVWTCNENWTWFLKVRTNEIQSFDPALYAKMLWWSPPFLLLVGLEKAGVGKMDQILVLSEEIRRIMRRTYGVDSRVVRSGPDLTYLDKNGKRSLQDPSLWRAGYGIRTRNLILTVGRLEAIKRFDLLIAAARQMSRRRNDFTIVIAGAGPQENKLRRLVALSNLEQVVRIVGQVSEEELYNWYNACDMFVFPSWCPWGLVVLEAMYYQKPCVVSRCAGVSEVLEDGVSAMITGASVEDTAVAISKLLDEPSLWRSLGTAGERLVRHRYNFSNYTQECIQILSTAASS